MHRRSKEIVKTVLKFEDRKTNITCVNCFY